MGKRKGIQRGMSSGILPGPRQPVWPPPVGAIPGVPGLPGLPNLGPIPSQDPAIPFLQAQGGAGGVPPAPVPEGEAWTGHVKAEAPNYWASEQRFLEFENPPNLTYGPPAPGVTSRAVWSTPLFDLRTLLLASAGYRGNTTGISQDVMLGIYFNLFVDITGIGGLLGLADPSEYQFYSMEFVSSVNPNNQAFVSRENITASVLAAQGFSFSLNTASLRWRPEGPIRYWGVAIVIDQEPVAVPTAPPTIRVDGALH